MDYKILQTDFYQLTMAFANIVLGRANIRGGFEAFVRNIRPKVNPEENYYFLNVAEQRYMGVYGRGKSVESKIAKLRDDILEELKDPMLKHIILGLIWDKLPQDQEHRDYLAKTFMANFEKANKKFELKVVNVDKIFPMVPVVQFNGPLWIGQLLETQILYTINGLIGYNTRKRIAKTLQDKVDLEFLECIINDFPDALKKYEEALDLRAYHYRDACDDKILFEAALRRAPTLKAANIATKVAVNGSGRRWDGTSNVASYFIDGVDLKLIGGTMAHSQTMSYRNELNGLVDWHKVYRGDTTYLIDTYNVYEALKEIIRVFDEPVDCVRIDSEPLEEYARNVRFILDQNGWNKTKIFISGDLTPERLRKFKFNGVPYDKCMAGTKYANIDILEKINAGFVYKLVEVEDEDGIFYPLKKSTGKGNYAGLKEIKYNSGNTLEVICGSDANYKNSYVNYMQNTLFNVEFKGNK